MSFEGATIAQVVVKTQTGVVDKDVKRRDCLDSRLNLRCVGYVQHQGRDAAIWVIQRLTCSCVHPLDPSPQGLLDQGLPDATVRPGYQN